MADTVKWYINRFKTLSAKELLFRINQVYKSRRDKRKVRKLYCPSIFTTRTRQLLHVDDPTSLVADPTVNIFGVSFHPDKIENWHVDVSSGKKFPNIYAKIINIRNDFYGSAKHVWELNRMLFLPQLALEYLKHRRQDTLDLIFKLLASWVEQNPFLVGVNWYSNIEVNIRLINWVLTWDILDVDQLIKRDEKLKRFVIDKWVPCIYSHCIFSYNNPSLHSSANNHLISEYAGLFIANCKWNFPESETWLSYAKKGLEKEIVLQHSENGINKEETAKYIQFITDFLLLSLIVGKRSGNDLSSVYTRTHYKIFSYIYQLLDLKGNVPNYGDEDDGRVFVLDPRRDANLFHSILVSGALYFNDTSILPDAVVLDQKNRLLFGRTGESLFRRFEPSNVLKTSKGYPKEGHFIFRLQESASKEIYFHFDAAPLGYLSIAAHGHSDALSFILNIDGIPFLVDSGTYCYHTHPEWRKYFLSSKAHNTITINDTNQATYVGPTLWLDHYKTTVHEYSISDNYDHVVAEHNGYDKFSIRHKRTVEFLKDVKELVITDLIENASGKSALIEMPFHIHPQINSRLSGDHLHLSSRSTRGVEVVLDPKLAWTMHEGESSPILGWYSSSFYKKERSTVCLGRISSKDSVQFVTVLKIS